MVSFKSEHNHQKFPLITHIIAGITSNVFFIIIIIHVIIFLDLRQTHPLKPKNARREYLCDFLVSTCPFFMHGQVFRNAGRAASRTEATRVV